jgi:predicted GNAT family acetyltransferase
MADQIEVTDNPEASRLEVRLGDEVAFTEYQRARGGMVFPHTVVPKAFEGKGVGSALVKAGLKMARDEDLKVIPLCSFWVSYLAKHPEYLDQVDPHYRERVGAKG